MSQFLIKFWSDNGTQKNKHEIRKEFEAVEDILMYLENYWNYNWCYALDMDNDLLYHISDDKIKQLPITDRYKLDDDVMYLLWSER